MKTRQPWTLDRLTKHVFMRAHGEARGREFLAGSMFGVIGTTEIMLGELCSALDKGGARAAVELITQWADEHMKRVDRIASEDQDENRKE